MSGNGPTLPLRPPKASPRGEGPLSLALLVASACAAPAVHPLQVAHVEPIARVEVPPPRPPPVPETRPRCEALDASTYELPALDDTIFAAPIPPVVDPTGRVMAPLYERIAARIRGRGGDPIRVGIYGDSNMTQDGISGGLRRTLQAKLGDAGHGYVALGRAWPWYLHMDVSHGATYSDWTAYSTSVVHTRDGYYGFANMAFDSDHAGARTYVRTADESAPVGRAVSHFDAYFLKQPAGGSFKVAIDGYEARVVSTASSKATAAFERFDVPDGAHNFEITVRGTGTVRVFGLTLERDEPGVVVDSLGTGALNYEQMTHVDAETRRAMLAHRKYDLVMFLLGSNVYAPSTKVLRGWVRSAVDAQRAAVPGVPVLILSPSDIAESMDAPASLPRIVWLVEQLRVAAVAEGAAYWDFWSAMGGDRSIVKLRRGKGLVARDLVHLTRVSGLMLGERLAHGLMNDFAGYLAAHPEAGCSPRSSPPLAGPSTE